MQSEQYIYAPRAKHCQTEQLKIVGTGSRGEHGTKQCHGQAQAAASPRWV